ncbi:hypothetical protein G647_08321 [Cladophialophora carrionii CBS 160.54]|uniref:Uncharacterized protein n=1 Tax=Cladophialophora carrionii CBS 160.54 TaxID=1279043 RepID=V9D2R9_9EURO|nr:uncharacterized protein G647_08321 [Cladophialophora carrionii CBS 160.54]ETI20287.1 hypothetical protein G647_08321 [Cladophialophora carrionii CBS 160.54]
MDDNSDVSTGDHPQVSWIKVEITATRELEIPVENGLLLTPDAVQNLIINDLPDRGLALSNLRVASLPEDYENAGDLQVGSELITDELKAKVAFRMVTDRSPPAPTCESVYDTDDEDVATAGISTDLQAIIDKLREKHAVQVAAGAKGQPNARAHRAAARNTARKVEELMRVNDLEPNNFPLEPDNVTLKSNTAGNRVKKPRASSQKRHAKQAKHAEQVKQESKRAPGGGPRDKAKAVHIHRLHNFTQRKGKDGIAAQLETFGRNEDFRTQKRLEKAAERRWRGKGSGLNEDKKVDLISEQLEKMLETEGKQADKKMSLVDKEAHDMEV